MPQQIIVSENGRTTIVPTGPVGPPGPEGPRGLQGIQGVPGSNSSGRHGSIMITTTEEELDTNGVVTEDGTLYQVVDLGEIGSAEVANVVIDHDLSHNILFRPSATCDPAVDQLYQINVINLGGVDDWVFSTLNTGGTPSVIAPMATDPAWLAITRYGLMQVTAFPMSASNYGLTNDFWLITNSGQAEPRVGSVFLTPRSTGGDPDLELDLRSVGASRAVIVTAGSGSKLNVLMPDTNLFEPFTLILAENTVTELHFQTGEDVFVVSIDSSFEIADGLAVLLISPSPDLFSPFGVGCLQWRGNLPTSYAGLWSTLHRGSDSVGDTDQVIGTGWTVGRWVLVEDAFSIDKIRIWCHDGGDTGAKVGWGIFAVKSGMLDGDPIVSGEIECPAVAGYVNSDTFTFAPYVGQLYAIAFQSDSADATIREANHDIPPTIDYGVADNTMNQGLCNNATTYGVWPTTMGRISWRPYVQFEVS